MGRGRYTSHWGYRKNPYREILFGELQISRVAREAHPPWGAAEGSADKHLVILDSGVVCRARKVRSRDSVAHLYVESVVGVRGVPAGPRVLCLSVVCAFSVPFVSLVCPLCVLCVSFVCLLCVLFMPFVFCFVCPCCILFVSLSCTFCVLCVSLVCFFFVSFVCPLCVLFVSFVYHVCVSFAPPQTSF